MTQPSPSPAPGSGKRLRVGEALLQQGLLSQEQLTKALEAQRSSGRMLGEMLVEQGVITNAVLVRTLAKCL